MGCKSPPNVPPATPFDVEIHEMELCSVLKPQEEGTAKEDKNLEDAAMDEGGEVEEKDTKTLDSNQEMPEEEQGVTSEAANEKSLC